MGRPRYGRDARRTVRAGTAAAEAMGHDAVSSEHLLLGVARAGGPGAMVLARLGVDTDQLQALVEERIAARGGDPDGPDPDALASLGIDLEGVRSRGHVADPLPRPRRRRRLSHEARVAIEAAVPVAADRREPRVTSAHLLVGLAVCRPARARDVLRLLDVDPVDILRVVEELAGA